MTPDIFGSAIVLVAPNNPAMYSPEWFQSAGLIGEADVSKAKNGDEFVVTGEVTAFGTDTFVIQVLKERIYLESNGVLTPALADVALGILTASGNLEVSQLGLNFFAHYKLDDLDTYHKVGDLLAPKSLWEAGYAQENVSFGMTTVAVKVQPFKRDEKPTAGDEIRLTAQPSTKVPRAVFLSVNHHSEVANYAIGKTKAEAAMEIIERDWEKLWHSTLESFGKILARAINDSGVSK